MWNASGQCVKRSTHVRQYLFPSELGITMISWPGEYARVFWMARWISQPMRLHGAWSLLIDTARTYGSSFGNPISSTAKHIAALSAWPSYWFLDGLVNCGCYQTPYDERLSWRTVSASRPLYHKTLLLPHLGRRFFWALGLIPIVNTLSSVRQFLLILPTRNNPDGIVFHRYNASATTFSSPETWQMSVENWSIKSKWRNCLGVLLSGFCRNVKVNGLRFVYIVKVLASSICWKCLMAR